MSLLKAGRKLRIGEKTFEVQGELGQGGSGVVYRVLAGTQQFALKVFFPYYQFPLALEPGQTLKAAANLQESLDFQRREFQFLANISHPNIVKVYGAGELSLSVAERKQIPIRDISQLPVLITELIAGEPFHKAIRSGLTADQVTFVLLRLARALEYLHGEKHYMHADIKAANILVRDLDKEPILIDFALCKNFNFSEVSRDERTRLLGDWDLFPKEIPTDHRLKAIKETDGTREEIFQLAFPYLDLFQVGKLLKSLMSDFQGCFDSRECRYLDALATDLTDWSAVVRWGPRDLAPKLERLGTEHFAAFGVPELSAPTSADRTLTLPPGIGVPITKQVQRIIETRSFRRLALINQLCMLHYVYPGAEYKRFVHVLTAYEFARQFAIHLYGSPIFRKLFDRRATQQLLATALLHDINHFPFLHIFQESEIPGLNKLEVVDLFCDGEVTGEKKAGNPAIYDLLGDVGIDPDRFKRLTFADHHRQQGPLVEIDQAISSLVNSGVDVDKLSYLSLDAHFTGVRYGAGIDFPALLKGAVLGQNQRQEQAIHIAFEDRALQAVENVVMTRFWNFRSLYWHHSNRAFMAMILHVVRKLYVEKKRNVRDYLLDTLWQGDIEALRYLDHRYYTEVGQPSILNGIIEDRSRLYKRIYTVNAGFADPAEDQIYVSCRRLDYQAERRFLTELALAVSELFPRPAGARTLTEGDLLIDIPRRPIDSGGPVYIASSSSRELVPLSELSVPIGSITENYDRLTKRVRIFVNPLCAGHITKEWRDRNRKQVQSFILEALDKSHAQSQVR